MKKFRTVRAICHAIESGEIPAECVSPGGAARLLGVTRQTVHDRIHKTESLEAWMVEDGSIILISERSIKLAQKKQRGIPDTQAELLPDGGAHEYA